MVVLLISPEYVCVTSKSLHGRAYILSKSHLLYSCLAWAGNLQLVLVTNHKMGFRPLLWMRRWRQQLLQPSSKCLWTQRSSRCLMRRAFPSHLQLDLLTQATKQKPPVSLFGWQLFLFFSLVLSFFFFQWRGIHKVINPMGLISHVMHAKPT